ncbi:MAG TPA: VOC family protein [Micropepsaceae bacterium]|nr:VOC family protein [Micropepsaceae bacterium]
MIDHVEIAVSDYNRARRFYEQALAPLGYGFVMEYAGQNGRSAGFGREHMPFFWFGDSNRPNSPVHVAFTAKNRAEVNAFHRAAMAAGGTDNGPPGLRPQYHPNYYGAFVLDPDGHNIEAVCHVAE